MVERREVYRPSPAVRAVTRARAMLDELLAEATSPEIQAVERSKAMGKFWTDAIADWGDVDEIAFQLGVTPFDLKGMRLGIKPVDFFGGPVPLSIARVMGRTEKYDEFCQTFGVERFDPNKQQQKPEEPLGT